MQKKLIPRYQYGSSFVQGLATQKPHRWQPMTADEYAQSKGYSDFIEMDDDNPDNWERTQKQLTHINGNKLYDWQTKEVNNMYNYLTKNKGLSGAAASAIMGNIYQESSFNPDSVSNKNAQGFLQLLGDKLNDYNKWLKTHKQHRYSQLDYMLESLADPSRDHYRREYEGSKRRIKSAQTLIANSKSDKERARHKAELKVLQEYHDNTFGKREKENRLFFYEGLRNALYNPNANVSNLTRLWHDTVERSHPSETNMDSRLKAAQAIYNNFNNY